MAKINIRLCTLGTYGGHNNFDTFTEAARPAREVGGVAGEEVDGMDVGDVGDGEQVTPHAAFFVVRRPGRSFVRRLLQLHNQHHNGEERAGTREGWGRRLQRAKAKGVSRLTAEFNWRTWSVRDDMYCKGTSPWG